MAILWNDTLSTGISELDEQHRELITRLNQLGEALIECKSQKKVREILDFTLQYAEKHFQHEESCMAQHNCPIAKLNQDGHQYFTSKFKKLKEEAERDVVDVEFAIKVHQELSDWFINHVWNVDTKLRSCVKKIL